MQISTAFRLGSCLSIIWTVEKMTLLIPSNSDELPMPFIPHTSNDVQEMLATIGVDSLDRLFEEVPAELCYHQEIDMPKPLSEMALTRMMHQKASQDGNLICFTGAGAYEHHIPAAIWEITTRGEFYTAYTPYQAEASQGTLQVLYEYQSMIASLTSMDIANASLYDGASALAEAILMAVRAKPAAGKRILLPSSVHPHYRQVVATLLKEQQIELVELPYCTKAGNTMLESLSQHTANSFAALVIPQPNFFGTLEETETLSNWAHKQGAMVIGLVNPLSLGMLQPPGLWGETGADIACGEGQPLGIPLSSGGPYFGFMACKQKYLRQMPGRIAGRTKDKKGQEGFVLTMQAREQHIRRAKATSNICTNQGLMTVAATIYMSLLGPHGLRKTAEICHANTVSLAQRLQKIPGVTLVFDRPFFHECVIRLPGPVEPVLAHLELLGISGGFALAPSYTELQNMLLVCATETRNIADQEQFAQALTTILAEET